MALIRKEREQHTKDLSHCTRALLDSIETPIMTINYDFSLCCWNKAASELLEIPEYTGTSHPLLINFIAPSFRNFVTNTIADATKNLKKQQILSHGHATMCTKNGIKRIMDLSFVPMPTNAKTIVSMMAEPHQTGHAKYTKSATICSYCKKLKNSRNGWVPIERFFEHITFSHGICPDCLEHIYPEYL
jgi:nitrogen-specific signal transduction histidine kinase